MGACLEWVNTIDDACDKRYLEEYAHGEYCHEQSFKWGFQEGVDWLEKQGEQKPVEPTDLRTWKYIVDAVLTEREGIGQYLDSPFTEEVAKKLQKRFGNVEQKSVELKKEEKSRLMKKCVHRAYQQGYDTGFFMATTELEHKQEWSEEDESMRIKCIGIFETYCAEEASRLITWLKSLKDRVQPQSKQEWSEEDERKISWIIAMLQNSTIRDAVLSMTNDECIDWLKSLRPQNKWKPSEEQLIDLEIVISDFIPISFREKRVSMENLLEQLKKLREE